MTPETMVSHQLATGGTVEVTMPSPGVDTEITVSAWLKRPGETVTEQEAICVVGWGTDRAEIASPATGVLRMVTLAAGQPVAVGSTLAVIDVALSAAAAGRFARD